MHRTSLLLRLSDSDFERSLSSFRAQCGRVTMLINNAGILPARPFLEFSDGETVRKIFEVNTYSQVSASSPKHLQVRGQSLICSQFWTIFEFLPDMLENGGHIVSMCSVAGVAPATYMVPYCASKHAIR